VNFSFLDFYRRSSKHNKVKRIKWWTNSQIQKVTTLYQDSPTAQNNSKPKCWRSQTNIQPTVVDGTRPIEPGIQSTTDQEPQNLTKRNLKPNRN